MSTRNKTAILILIFILLGWFIFQPVREIFIFKPYLQKPVAGQKFNARELEDFLNVHIKMMQGSYNEELSQLSMFEGNKYPDRLVRWLELQYWDAERFIYNEQRLCELVRCVDIKRQIDDNRRLVAHKAHSVNNIIKNQERLFQACRFPKDEMELIKLNME